MIHKNWQELIRPSGIKIKSGDDPKTKATIVTEPLERGFGLTPVSYTHLTLPTICSV